MFGGALVSTALFFSQHRWKAALAAAVIIPGVILVLWPADRRQPLFAPSEPASGTQFYQTPSPMAMVTSDAAIARAVAAQQALQRSEQALQAADQALMAPEIPERGVVWSSPEDPLEAPALALNPQVSHAEVVRLSEPHLLEKMPGDRLTVPLPEGRSLAVTVEEATRLPNGDYSWRGYVDGEGDDFPVIFTLGKNSAFATITSWEGSYTMESVGGVGWLYRSIVDPGEDSIPAPAGGDIPHHHP